MITLPKPGDTVHVIVDGEYIMPFYVWGVSQQTYVGAGNETPHVPADRQVAVCRNERIGYKLIEVPKLSLETVATRNSKLPKKRRCEMCKRQRKRLGTHHIDGDKENNDPSNRMTLCPRCHTKWHWQHGKRGKRKTSVVCFCGDQSFELGMCRKHYQRFKRHGDPMLVKIRNGGLVRADS